MRIRTLTRSTIRAAAILTLTAVVTVAPPASAQEGLKIYISADMEGVVGTVTGEQLGPNGFEYERARRWMTEEVNAAIRGARAAGATEILVSDSHGNGQNLLLDELPADITVIRSWPRPLAMMAGIDDTFDGAIFVGYHTSTDNSTGVRAHTMSSARLTSVKLNGVPVPETGLNAAIAGHFGVPVIMLTGDDAIAEEATDLLGDLETAVVKKAYGFHAAIHNFYLLPAFAPLTVPLGAYGLILVLVLAHGSASAQFTFSIDSASTNHGAPGCARGPSSASCCSRSASAATASRSRRGSTRRSTCWPRGITRWAKVRSSSSTWRTIISSSSR